MRPGPPIIVSTSRPLSAEQAAELAARFERAYSRGKVIVLPPGMSVRSPTLREWLECHTRGMTSRRWQLDVPAVYVAVADVLPIQREPLELELGRPRSDVAHVVEIDGRLYLQDGHHRFFRARRAGNPWLLARVLHARG